MKLLNIWRVIVRKFSLKSYLNKNKEKLIAWSLLSRVLAVIFILSLAPTGVFKVNASEESNTTIEYISTIQLDIKRTIPAYVPVPSVPKIVVGESNSNRAQREAKERDAALKRTQGVSRSTKNVLPRDNRPAPVDPGLTEKRALAKKAANAYGIDWKILEAVWQVESGKAWNTTVISYAGAQGPMQFMRGTWRKYAVDGNGDGSADINHAEDAVYAGANLLAQAGAANGNVDAALLSYNHAQWYVNKVKAVANSIVE